MYNAAGSGVANLLARVRLGSVVVWCNPRYLLFCAYSYFVLRLLTGTASLLQFSRGSGGTMKASDYAVETKTQKNDMNQETFRLTGSVGRRHKVMTTSDRKQHDQLEKTRQYKVCPWV